MRALVIDDSRVMRGILRRFLAPCGFEVVEAGDGRQGMEQLRLAAPDLVLVDWNMPEMDGLSFIRAVRAVPACAGLRLLMITTENETHRVAEALEAGASEYLMKPFTREALLEKLDLLGVSY
ncbi:MAG TPA: response regulator [Gemmataceae bacterium]|nr:response regulator [Gemmataceae bacterium]